LLAIRLHRKSGSNREFCQSLYANEGRPGGSNVVFGGLASPDLKLEACPKSKSRLPIERLFPEMAATQATFVPNTIVRERVRVRETSGAEGDFRGCG
jgi:hypothetical protein